MKISLTTDFIGDKNMKEEKANGNLIIILMAIGSISLIMAMLVLYIPKITSSDSVDSIEYVFGLVILILVAGTTLLAISKKRDLNKGLPIGDEFTHKVAYKAGYYSWLITMWVSVLVMMLQDLLEKILNINQLTIEHFTGIIVLGSGITFLALSYYLAKRGEVD